MDIELSDRAIACKHWKWMPGMLYQWGRISDDDHADDINDDPEAWDWPEPNLNDPATLGCLLALVREAWGDEHIASSHDADPCADDDYERWYVSGSARGSLCAAQGSTEAEALVAALEAAP